MTEQNSASISSSPLSWAFSASWDERKEVPCHPSVSQAVSLSLAQWQSKHQDENGQFGESSSLKPPEDMDKQISSLSDKVCPLVDTLREEQQRLEQLKEDFLSTISHELKTPLSSMYLSIQLLELLLFESEEIIESSEASPDSSSHAIQRTHSMSNAAKMQQRQDKRSKIQQCLETLSKECRKEITLVNNLLFLQESTATLPAPALTCIVLHDWLEDVLSPFYNQFQDKRHQFYCDISPSLSYIISDHIRLEKIVQELMTNACKFTPDNGHISLSVFEEDNVVMLTVLSKGDAIPSEEIPNLFNIFHRIPKADRWSTGGTGIGLALVKKWVEAIGGEIRVASGTFGNAFILYLPSPKQMKQVGA